MRLAFLFIRRRAVGATPLVSVGTILLAGLGASGVGCGDDDGGAHGASTDGGVDAATAADATALFDGPAVPDADSSETDGGTPGFHDGDVDDATTPIELDGSGSDGATADGASADGGATDGGHLDAARLDGGPPVVDPACMLDGCVRSSRDLGSYSAAALATLVEPSIAPDLENGYSIYEIRYYTHGREAVATVTIPYGASPPADGYPVVANAHGTTGLDDPCAVTGTLSGPGLAGLFGARGAISIAHDYPGLGTGGLLPYLVSEVEGTSTLDALRAATALARIEGVPVANRHAVVGLSEGGHAVLAAAALHASYAPELDVRGFAASGPASVWAEHWQSGAAFDGPHLVFHALVAYAWTNHYGFGGPSPFAAELSPRLDDIMQNVCFGSGARSFVTELGTDRTRIFTPAFLDEYTRGAWSTWSEFGDWYAANRVVPYMQTAPLKIWQGAADTTVPEAHTTEMVEALRAGGVDVEYDVVAGGGHIDVAFGFLAYRQLRTDESVAWVEAQLTR